MTTDTNSAWLANAEEAYAVFKARLLRNRLISAKSLAEAVNSALGRLGIEPLHTAGWSESGSFIPARLVEPDPERELYGVLAAWDEESDAPVLLTLDHYYRSSSIHEALPAGPLRSSADVARARHEGPAPKPLDRVNPYEIAQRALRAGGGSETSADADHIAEAIRGLTAAVVQLTTVVRG